MNAATNFIDIRRATGYTLRVLVFAAATMTAACGGVADGGVSSTAPTGGAPRSATSQGTATSSSQADDNSCGLVSQADVSAVVGFPITKVGGAGGECVFQAADDSHAFFHERLQDSGGDAGADAIAQRWREHHRPWRRTLLGGWPDREVVLEPGELFVVQKGIEHCPFSEGETQILLIEPKGVVNTGDAGGELTATAERI